MDSNRQKLREDFLNHCARQSMQLKPLAQDASFRRYFRLETAQESYILMDAPPDKEQIKPFILIAQHLSSLGLCSPKILNYDCTNGFILLEDLGDNTFTRLLNDGFSETKLYYLAVDVLIKLHHHQQAKQVAIADYSTQTLIDEALLMCDWYFPKQTGRSISTVNRNRFIESWESILAAMPKSLNTLVLRDFHVDNLIMLENGDCGLLDFQDALVGPAAYDLVSLLEDARRDLSPGLTQQLLNHYFDQFVSIDKSAYMKWYTVLGVQRHCKVLGIFTRLSVRDNKHHYLEHINRVECLLKSHLDVELLKPLKNWISENNLLLSSD